MDKNAQRAAIRLLREMAGDQKEEEKPKNKRKREEEEEEEELYDQQTSHHPERERRYYQLAQKEKDGVEEVESSCQGLKADWGRGTLDVPRKGTLKTKDHTDDQGRQGGRQSTQETHRGPDRKRLHGKGGDGADGDISDFCDSEKGARGMESHSGPLLCEQTSEDEEVQIGGCASTQRPNQEGRFHDERGRETRVPSHQHEEGTPEVLGISARGKVVPVQGDANGQQFEPVLLQQADEANRGTHSERVQDKNSDVRGRLSHSGKVRDLVSSKLH